MRYFLLDTNILLAYLRAGNRLFKAVSDENRLDEEDAFVMISVVNKGEVRSIALRNNWGEQRVQALEALLSQLVTVDANAANDLLLNAYAEIDAYSHKRHPQKSYAGPARTMAKNDVWIAATAYATNATLLTTDGDFDHLDGVFIQVKRYQVSAKE